jgi:hypothetical protein
MAEDDNERRMQRAPLPNGRGATTLVDRWTLFYDQLA